MASIAGVSSRIGTFAIAVQTAKGAAAATMTNKFYFSGAPSIKPVKSEGRYSMTDSSRFMQGDPYISGLSVAGQVPLYAHPDLMGYLFYLALGAKAESGAAPPYIHTLTASATLPYFTAWKFMGAGIIEKYTDCQINSIQITGSPGQPLQVTLDIIGITSTFLAADVTTVDPSVTTPLNYADGSGALQLDATAYPLHAFDMTISNNLVGFQADAYTFDAIDPQGLDISGSFAVRVGSATSPAAVDYRKFFYSTTQTAAGSDAGTVQTISIGTHAFDFKWSSPTANNSLQIQIPVARYADLPVNPDPSGSILEYQVTFEVMRAGFTAHVENTPITVIASDTVGALTAS